MPPRENDSPRNDNDLPQENDPPNDGVNQFLKLYLEYFLAKLINKNFNLKNRQRKIQIIFIFQII